MFSSVSDTLTQLLPARRRRSASGWISFNAVCCQHRGERADTRGRGGVISTSDGAITYHCFNCNFKTGYRPGNYLGYRFRRLLIWLGADEATVNRLVIEAVRIRDYTGESDKTVDQEPIDFKPRALPDDVELVDSDPRALEYCQRRHINLDRYPLLVSKKTDHNLNRRVIIPFTWNNQLIGYSARAWDPMIKPRYHSQYEPNYVFNLDQQPGSAEFVIVCEGPFDAMSIDGCAVLSNECSERQADIIDTLNREVILVPDADRAGQRLVDSAIKFGWSVSFPIWHETCKDINDAVVKYGQLFVLKTILAAKETSKLKIELKRRWLYN